MKKVTTAKLPEYLSHQLLTYIQVLRDYNEKLPDENKKIPLAFDFLEDFYRKFIIDRNTRALEVASDDYAKILNMATSLLPMKTSLIQCMDGRVKAILTYGFSAGVASSIRVPAGDIIEFVRSGDGKLKLTPNSNFTHLIQNVFSDKEYLAIVYDSHVGCAARRAEEEARGHYPTDSGLYSDVLHKREIALATKNYYKEQFSSTKQLSVIQTSFDPHTGFLFMGLETKKALTFAKDEAKKMGVSTPEYTSVVLNKLVEKKLIISTQEIVTDKKIRSIFEQHFFDIDWKNNYLMSAKLFWENISKMKKSIEPFLVQRIIAIYPHDSENKENSKEIAERIILLLTNAYNAYLHNTSSSKELRYNISHPNEHNPHHYPYGEHDEEGVKVSSGGFPQYQIPMFVIDDGVPENLPAYIELASKLVRGNRLAERIKDRSGNFTDKNEFAKAPVPVVIQAIIFDKNLTEEDWKILQSIDWSDLPNTPWNTMLDTDFDKYLESKAGHLPIAIANSIKSLRKKMQVLYHPDSITSAHLIDMHKVALSVVCDYNRKTHALIPFIKTGLL